MHGTVPVVVAGTVVRLAGAAGRTVDGADGAHGGFPGAQGASRGGGGGGEEPRGVQAFHICHHLGVENRVSTSFAIVSSRQIHNGRVQPS